MIFVFASLKINKWNSRITLLYFGIFLKKNTSLNNQEEDWGNTLTISKLINLLSQVINPYKSNKIELSRNKHRVKTHIRNSQLKQKLKLSIYFNNHKNLVLKWDGRSLHIEWEIEIPSITFLLIVIRTLILSEKYKLVWKFSHL